MSDSSKTLTSSSYQGRKNRVVFEQFKDVENNRSRIHWTLYVEGGTSNYYTTGPITITIGGTQAYYCAQKGWSSQEFPAAKGSTSGDVYINHSSDGTKTITVQLTTAIYVDETTTYSASWTLSSIARASSVTCADGNIGSATTININRASSSFKHTLTYSFSNLSGTIATKTSNTSVGWTIPTSFYAKIPNAKSGQGTITCQTYSGDTLIGTKTCTFNAFVVNSDPTITATITDTNSDAVAATGDSNKLIRYVSNAQVVITATPKNSATISSVKVVSGSKSSTSTTSTLNAVDSGTFNLSCVDSRGNTGSATVTKTMINYIKPAIITAQLSRAGSESDTINASISGQIYNGSFGSSSNTCVLKYRYKLSTASSWGSYTTKTATKSGNTFSYSGTLGTSFDHTKSYDFQIVVSDLFKSNTVSVTVTRGMPIVDIGSDDIVINGDLEVTGKMTRPVGSIEITNTYSNPSSYLAGTWTLINKVFTSLGSSSSDIFTRDSNNTSSSTPYMTRNGQAINLHISVKTSVALGDTSVILGVVEFPFIGITGLMNSVYSIGSSDTGDGVVLLTMDYQTGTLRSTDVVTKTSGGTIASGSTITADFTFVVGSGSMINEKCSQFVWKRTA